MGHTSDEMGINSRKQYFRASIVFVALSCRRDGRNSFAPIPSHNEDQRKTLHHGLIFVIHPPF